MEDIQRAVNNEGAVKTFFTLLQPAVDFDLDLLSAGSSGWSSPGHNRTMSDSTTERSVELVMPIEPSMTSYQKELMFNQLCALRGGLDCAVLDGCLLLLLERARVDGLLLTPEISALVQELQLTGHDALDVPRIAAHDGGVGEKVLELDA